MQIRVERPHEKREASSFGGLHAILGEMSGNEAFSFLAPRFREAFGATGSLVDAEEASGASGDAGDPFTRRGFFVGESVTEAEELKSSFFFSPSRSSSGSGAAAASAAFLFARRNLAA